MPTSPVYPLGPPTVAGNDITVDMMLNQPSRITRYISDLTLTRFIADRIFTSAGGVQGGAVVYDQATVNELYTSRDVEQIAPGSLFPELASERQAPKIAPVEKWGGKVKIPDEARDRNNSALFTNRVRQVANTIVRKINQRAIAELEASIVASGQTIAGVNWGAVVTGGSSQSNNSLWPARDFAKAQELAEVDELGVVYDLWLINPQEWSQLATIYGNSLNQVLAGFNIEVIASNRVAPGTAYVIAQGQVGEMKIEKPLGSETWRDSEIESTWVQSSVRPVMYVTNPFAVQKFTGLAG